jgi:CysZ protein
MGLPEAAEALRMTLLNPEPLGFRRGVRAPFEAAGLLLSRPRLLGLCVVPWLLNVLVVVPLALGIAVVLHRVLHGLIPTDSELLYRVAGVVLLVLLLPFTLATTALFFLLGAVILGAPFHDKIGEAVERERFGTRTDLLAPPTSFGAGVAHSLREAVKRVLLVIPVFLGVLVLGVVPVIGPVLAVLAQGCTAAAFLTFDAFSNPMDRRGITAGRKLRWLWANRRFALGFGLPMLAVPCAIFLMPPLAAVAASMVYAEFLKAENPAEADKDDPGRMALHNHGQDDAASS